jgi:hypothetical protein
VLVYDWRAKSSKQFGAVARLVQRYDRVFVRMGADGNCEAIVLHWGQLHRYEVERDGFAMKVESREICGRLRVSIGIACLTAGAMVIPLWHAWPHPGEVLGTLFFDGVIGLILFRIAVRVMEDMRVRTFVPDLKHWVSLEGPADNG